MIGLDTIADGRDLVAHQSRIHRTPLLITELEQQLQQDAAARSANGQSSGHFTAAFECAG